MKSERDFFIEACFSDDLQVFYKSWIAQKPDRIQFFTKLEGVLSHKYWNPSNLCCIIGDTLTKDNIDIKISYWTPFIWKPILKSLKIESMKKEAYMCQLIDSNCNDCFYLDRGNKKCLKFDKNIQIYPGISQVENKDCFKHRKDI